MSVKLNDLMASEDYGIYAIYYEQQLNTPIDSPIQNVTGYNAEIVVFSEREGLAMFHKDRKYPDWLDSETLPIYCKLLVDQSEDFY